MQEVAESVAEVERSLAGVRRQLGRTQARVVLRLRPRPPEAAVRAGPLRATLLWDAYQDTMTATLRVCHRYRRRHVHRDGA